MKVYLSYEKEESSILENEDLSILWKFVNEGSE